MGKKHGGSAMGANPNHSCPMRRLIAFLISCTLLPTAWLAVVIDQWTGASRSLAFEGFFISLGFLMGTVVMQYERHKAMLLVPVAYVLFILVLPFVDISPVKPAVRAVGEITPGMTEHQVRAVLDHHFPGDGRFKRPEIGALSENVLMFALDPDDGRYNAAIVQIKFSAGKCLSAEFLPD
jgi:hypothetical protein